MKDKLTAKQRRFVEVFCGEAQCNATQAARLAGYKGNSKTLRTIGTENMAKHGVKHAIEALQRKETKKNIMTREEILEQLSEIAKEKEASKGDQIKAMDTINKMRGEYVLRHDVTITALTREQKEAEFVALLEAGDDD